MKLASRHGNLRLTSSSITLLIVGLTAGGYGGSQLPRRIETLPQELKASRIELVDSEGNTRGIIGELPVTHSRERSATSEYGILFYGKDGKYSAVIGANQDGVRATFANEGESSRWELGCGAERASLSFSVPGIDGGRRQAVDLTIINGNPQLTLHDRQYGQVFVGSNWDPFDKTGSDMSLEIHSSREESTKLQSRCIMGVSSTGESWIDTAGIAGGGLNLRFK